MRLKKKILGQDRGIVMNGQPVATMSTPSRWGHLRREDIIHVAPGMDILLAVGMNWVRVDKENSDMQSVSNATGSINQSMGRLA